MISDFPFTAGRAVFISSAVPLFVALFHTCGQTYYPLISTGSTQKTNLLYHTSRKWTWAMASLAIFPGALKGSKTFRVDISTISPISHRGEAGEGVRTVKTRGEKRARSGMGLSWRKKKQPNVRTQRYVRDIGLRDLLPLKRKHHPSLCMWAPV